MLRKADHKETLNILFWRHIITILIWLKVMIFLTMFTIFIFKVTEKPCIWYLVKKVSFLLKNKCCQKVFEKWLRLKNKVFRPVRNTKISYFEFFIRFLVDLVPKIFCHHLLPGNDFKKKLRYQIRGSSGIRLFKFWF